MFHGLDHVRLQDHLVMIGAELARHHAGIFGLVEVSLGETDREGLHRTGTGARHQRDDGGRIDAAAEKRSQRHIGDQTDASRLQQAPLQFLQTLFFTLGCVRAILR